MIALVYTAALLNQASSLEFKSSIALLDKHIEAFHLRNKCKKFFVSTDVFKEKFINKS